jgi:hypothetical protein
MKQQFVPNQETAQRWEDHAETEQDVWDACPWASVVIECEGGWQVFESMVDADTWRKQV